MNLKPTEPDPVDRFIADLRGVTMPDVVRVPRLPSGRRSLKLAPPVAAMAIAVAATVWLRPVPASAAEWSEVVRNTQASPRRHFQEFDPRGRMVAEFWTSGAGYASWYAPSWAGRVILEERTDGRRRYRLSESIVVNSSVPKAANERTFGTVQNVARTGRSIPLSTPSTDFDAYVRAFAESVEPVSGSEDVFRVTFRSIERGSGSTVRPIRRLSTVRIDAQRRIVEKVDEDGTRAVFEYPDAIAASTFEPRPQKRTVPVLDLDVARTEAERRLVRGYGTKREATLRLVLLDRSGNVWILWTGMPPDGRLTHPARLLGVPSHGKFGPAGLTSSKAGRAGARRAPSIGERIYGHGVRPKVTLGAKVSVAIPARGGIAVFRDVPVLRVATLSDVASLIGLSASGSNGYIDVREAE